jgi:hypothetical protein
MTETRTGPPARHGAGDADLTIMLGAHAALRRDLIRLARVADSADLGNPTRRAAVDAGWETFKRQLHLHHTAEDQIVWPALRSRLADSSPAQSVLDAMEEEHKEIDPLLAGVDEAFADADGRYPADAVGALATSIASHLDHEELDGLPLIGMALTAAEWRGVGFKIARASGLSKAGEMFAWIAEGADPDAARATLSTLPPPARLIYRVVWKPRYERVPRW